MKDIINTLDDLGYIIDANACFSFLIGAPFSIEYNIFLHDRLPNVRKISIF